MRLVALAVAVLPLVTTALSPIAVDAADPANRRVRVGVVYPESRSSVPPAVGVFWRRLAELGWVEGRNLVVESRWADGRADRLPALMPEVIGQDIELLVTWTTPAAVAAKAATAATGTPVVVAVMGDPVATGIVASLARPGGNLTGLALGHDQTFAGKWLQILQEVVPRLANVAVIFNPDNQPARKQTEGLRTVSSSLGLKLRFIEVRDWTQIERAFAMARQNDQAFVMLADALSMRYRGEIAALAAKAGIPGIYVLREFVDAGGLISYGADNNALFRRAAEYADRILRGAQPSDLPIEQPTKIEMVVNLKAAEALGLTIPQSILLRADEVIR